jgi:flagellar motor protein MotB
MNVRRGSFRSFRFRQGGIMKFQRLVLVLVFAVASLLSGCTTRYQDMLRERDARIRELSGDVARLRGENDELQRRLTTQPMNATAQPESRSLLTELQNEIGEGADVRYNRGRISIGVEDSVTFDSGSTALKTSAHRTLQNIAGVLQSKFAGRRIWVEGHTDSDPIQRTKDKFRSNRHLSMERADAVATYLIRQGVPESAIVVVGYGQFDPRDPGVKARNRRVEIVVGDAM